jgi:hypothetical protein
MRLFLTVGALALAMLTVSILIDRGDERKADEKPARLERVTEQVAPGLPEPDLAQVRTQVEPVSVESEESAVDSPPASALFEPRLLDLIGEARCRSFAALHADSSKRQLIDVLRQIHDRVPGDLTHRAARDAIDRGDFEVLREVMDDGTGWTTYNAPKKELDRNIPFTSMIMHLADGRVARVELRPEDIAGYADQVSEAIWIHFYLVR